MFLLVDKPKGITSHDVVDEVRKIIRGKSPSARFLRIKVGHAGTLDPNATGLLIVGIGRESTKKLGRISKDSKKTYVAEICLGEERETDDALGKIRKTKFEIRNKLQITNVKLQKILRSFLGGQEQIPPAYSAIKIEGKKAYEMARKGKKVNLKPRKITIYSIKLLSYKYPILEIETEVSAGTYIRALARDIGRKLGCGAYLKNLQRTKIGKYSLKNAYKLNFLNKSNWKDLSINESIH